MMDGIVSENILCKNVKLQFISKKLDSFNKEVCWFKVIGKKNMMPILTIFNVNEESNRLKEKQNEEQEKISFPFFLNEMENFLIKIKKGSLKMNDEQLVKDNTFKLNLNFKYYDFVKKSEQFKGYYVSEAFEYTPPNENMED
jgi:hypothetical protein